MTGAHGDLAIAYGRLGMYDDMRREAAILVEQLQDSFPLVRTVADAWVAHLEDDVQALRGLLPELEANVQDVGINAHDIAMFHFSLGETDKGFDWLEYSFSRKESDLMFIKLDSELDRVRADPRYIDFLKRLGLE
jgi:hypothetical protein